MGVMFKKQADFVREHLDSIEELLGPDNPKTKTIDYDKSNFVTISKDGSSVMMVIDGVGFEIDRKEIDMFINVENAINNLSNEELSMVTAKGTDKGLKMGAVSFRTKMEPTPMLVVSIGDQTWTFGCTGQVTIDAVSTIPEPPGG